MRNFLVYSSLPQIIKKCGYILLLGAFLLAPKLTKAQVVDPLEVAQKLQDTYEKALSLVADFNQTTTMKFSSRIRQGSGTMVFRKPGRMRWDYLTPDYQVLISDGETISMYFEKSQQMIITNAKDYLRSDVTYSFFAGTGNILKDFDVSESDIYPETDNYYIIKMTPKSVHPQVSALYLWIAHNTFLITHMQIIDHFETVTDLFFDNIKINTDHYGNSEITNDLFLFRPPVGTEIIEQ